MIFNVHGSKSFLTLTVSDNAKSNKFESMIFDTAAIGLYFED